MSAAPNEPTVTVPTRRVIAAAVAAAAVAGVGWAVTTLIAGRGAGIMQAGVAEAAVVAVGSAVVLVLVRPGRRRPFSKWILVWMVAFPAQVALTLVLTLLLYSATRFSGVALLISFLVASLSTLTAETWVCVSHLKKVAAPVDAPLSE